ncbi:HAMP domain-containing histidine kinase [Dolichospermum sp. LEGE 00240]|jgi:two-component system, sensor histidine kinase and response regulator|uniref:hybrid sensor histidine kinase/response regulator n=1 Tax=Dolichospermum sp. LEGE 00240 TaxID=1828603 RepID=UPI00187FAB3C|nr:HAMP domain-containing sensor histidine kinase [Dolichospermum sp. LEGE 00240]MBE9248242.1 HAMP domain-containing histidine kinase [Dolichospermum sp. LEGE 00240]MDM3845016.1 HAMP domain-containing sensor histidine kinase [Aphanizomenon gracile PMC638.10]MDM3855241.1 HAMP domain-containing sensor histidine kinase [Aphanizomenon gracile PMC649.10]
MSNLKKARILSVDDVPDNLTLLRTILEIEGYEIDGATDGKMALEKVIKSPPDLIILDVMMPEISGYEVTQQIRNNSEINYIPILLLTAHPESSVVEGLDIGADDFLRKPFEIEELLARVRSLLRLKHSIDEQRKMTLQREDFVSRLTHDLRTPLIAANRVLNLFLQEVFGEIPSEMKQPISIMIRSNQNLLEMVNTLLEVYRFEAGQKNLYFEACNLITIATEVISELNFLALEKNLTLKLDTHELTSTGNDGGIVKADRLELRRVFHNLIGNAIKFTDTGSIEIRIFETLSPANHCSSTIIIEVQDTGYGIAPEDQETIFERFRQGKNKRSGSGLGLHLCSRIIEAHGGKIELSSEIGKGSIFTVKLPKITP